MQPLYEWLLEGEPWITYRIRVDLLEEAEQTSAVQTARQAMLEHPAIRDLIHSLADWDVEIITSHKKGDLLMHRLSFLADLGLTLADPGMEAVVHSILSHLSPEGIPLVGINVPVHFGGTGTDSRGWALCDTPVILRSLIAFGLAGRPDLMPISRLAGGIRHLRSLSQDNGWPCAVSPELGKFRGPGKKGDPCPDATLLMLKLLLEMKRSMETVSCALPADLQNLESDIRVAAESLLDLWEHSLIRHPYLFYMGTDFRKLKAPFIWYDILHVTDTLSRCSGFAKDERLLDMTRIIMEAGMPDGRFTPQSVWKAWSEWEFGQKKEPSRWLTFLALRNAKRLRFPLHFSGLT